MAAASLGDSIVAKPNRVIRVVAVALLSSLAPVRAADVLSDNLDAPQAGVESLADNYWIASSFGTGLTPRKLSTVTLPLTLFSGSSAAIMLEVHTSAGALPGAPGVKLELLSHPVIPSFTPGEVVVTSSGLVLESSATYWVVLHVQGTSTVVDWPWSDSDAGSGVGFQHSWAYSGDWGGAWVSYDTLPMLMRVEAEPIGPWTDLGFALAGSGGLPQLQGMGTLLPGSAGSIQLADGLSFAPALMFVATSSAPVPFKGGTLVPVPVSLALAIVPGAPGDVFAWSSWPPGLAGVSFCLQAAIQDPVAVKGVSLSNALRALVP